MKLGQYRFSFQKDILKENPALITSPLKLSESKASLLNETHLIPIQKTEQSRDSPPRTDRGQLDSLLEMAMNLEMGMNAQNLKLRNEIQDLKIEIYNLREKKVDKAEYDDIKVRLTEMADQQLGLGKQFIPNHKVFRLQKRTRGIKRMDRERDTLAVKRNRLSNPQDTT